MLWITKQWLWSTLLGVITWAVSADKHGVLREDAVHAMLYAYYIDEAFDEPRVPTGRPAHPVPGPTPPARGSVAGGDGRGPAAA